MFATLHIAQLVGEHLCSADGEIQCVYMVMAVRPCIRFAVFNEVVQLHAKRFIDVAAFVLNRIIQKRRTWCVTTTVFLHTPSEIRPIKSSGSAGEEG
jgi:hypothetical protein